jgi:hypothetical protein
MKYVAAAFLLTIIAGIGLPTPARGDYNDLPGAACADIVGGAGSYDGTTLRVTISTAKPSCPGLTYTLYVLDGPTAPDPLALIASQSLHGTRSTELPFSLPSGSPQICVFATTSSEGHIFDRAPDVGCVENLGLVICPDAAPIAAAPFRPCPLSFH